MKKQARIFGVVLACTVLAANAETEITPEAYVGGLHGTAAACKKIMPDAVRLGLKEMNAKFEGHGFNLPQIVETADYKTSFAEEIERIKSLTAQERVGACEWAFGEWQAQGAGQDANSQNRSKRTKQH